MNRKSKIQNLKWAGFLAILVLLVGCVGTAEAQQPGKVYRIGYLSPRLGIEPRDEAFRQGLRELGYIEGKNIVIEYRYADGKLDRLPALAAELVNLKVDVIVSGNPAGTGAAKDATKTIPIIMTQDPDPVGNGYAASLARPGGNITGLSNFASEISGKRLELLKEMVPRLARVAVLGNSTNPGNAKYLNDTHDAAAALRVQVQYLDVRSRDEIETAFQATTKWRADAALFLGSTVFNSHRPLVAELAIKNRLPAIFYAPEWVENGVLATYSANNAELWRRAATYVDKIVKGAKPADLPVEQPTKFELVINLKTAKQIGVTIPPNVLARADKVIK